MNKKSLGLTVLAVFIFIAAFEYLFHGVIMKETYHATASLWRPEAEMKNYCAWMLGGQFLFALMFCVIFAKGYQNRGTLEGVRYGILVTLLFAGPNFIMYAVAPYSLTMVMAWLAGMFVEFILAGLIAAAVYKK